jgi:lysozyme family protein
MANVKLTDTLRTEYQQLFRDCVIDPAQASLVGKLVNQLDSNRSRYEAVADGLGIPWYFIAVIHNMEASQNFSRHLHNGDPLMQRTTHAPAGRPKSGNPPFTWEQSAADALTLKGLDEWDDWSIAGTLYQIEGYNGWGYRRYHPHVKSPYLWGFSNHYVSGKYIADGTWSETAVSRQCGAAVLLRRMAERGIAELVVDAPTTAIARKIDSGEPLLAYSTSGKKLYAEELQKFLSQFPGVHLKPDGWPGKNTSDAFRLVTGYYLKGDPRA